MPPSSPPPPLAAMAPRSRRRRSKRSLTLHVSVFHGIPLSPWERDWAELPLDPLWYILRKLDQVELLIGGAAGVCRSWRRAARGEPELWRRIDMRGQFVLPFREEVSLKMMVRHALRLSAGQCEAFAASGGVNDDLLLFLAEQAPLLKSLRLISCCDVSNEAFAEAIKKFPLIEELELEYCSHINVIGVLERVAKACPRMKHFNHLKHLKGTDNQMDQGMTGHTIDREALAIAGVQNLRSLELCSYTLSNEGLAAILDNCPHLEYLNVHHCYNINMDDNLQAKCARIKTGHYEHFQNDSPVRSRPPRNRYDDCRELDTSWDDSWELSFYLSEDDDDDQIDLEQRDRILDKRMRRYLRIN